MTITKETAYKYLKDTGAMNEYSDNFFVSGLHTVPPKSGVNAHAIVNFGYISEHSHYTVKYKNVYIRDIDYKRWVRETRLKKLNEVL